MALLRAVASYSTCLEIAGCIRSYALRNGKLAQALSASHGSLFSTTSADQPASASPTTAPPLSELAKHLKTKIMMRGGPITLAEYMQDVLTNPNGGFYMNRDVFGSSGDFVTSPEISQMFGEMVGIWAVHTWMQLGQPQRLQLVELGPGRGTLMADLLRGTARFKDFARSLEVRMVEVSPELRKLQWQALRCSPSKLTEGGTQLVGEAAGPTTGVSGLNGAEVTWHASLDAVPSRHPTLYIAHEFFDALPVHQFVLDPAKDTWLEKLVDTVEEGEGEAGGAGKPAGGAAEGKAEPSSGAGSQGAGSSGSRSGTGSKEDEIRVMEGRGGDGSKAPAAHSSSSPFRLVLSPHATPASALLVPRRLAALKDRGAAAPKALEVSAVGMATAEKLSQRLGASGGAALIIDYGKDGPYEDSLIAIRQHKGVGIFDHPGSADLSAWVDFDSLAQAALGSGAEVEVHGPVSQAEFLGALGIQARMQQLMQRATPAQAQTLQSGYLRLLGPSPQGMGQAYMAMCISQKGLAAKGLAGGFTLRAASNTGSSGVGSGGSSGGSGEGKQQ